ncbi:hypothetical protein C8Q69DRAFT_489862 [Paecilomyces variotii]|uniref:NmrA-like domain-containing protein n=1 Tax=Byssochlamys spectabilis TaxID=264951 RepID=A0A443I722_BYSSP|nr:hypothetical protein C8Q69DRAFT_489862 [Paecilomyces variotii]RWQ99884.1 hypothetical protein C8Q69DRAFT_489862 [Paecilomyces variotii]
MVVDYDNDLILVTCASGKQAPYLLRHLQPKWKRLRLTAHSDTSVQRLKEQYPKAEVVKADMNNAADASRSLSGVTAIWHVGPSLHPHESEVGYTMIDAAVVESRRQGSNFQHFVYSSVLQTQLRKLMNHNAKRYVEEYLMEPGLNFTILQPSHFVDGFFSIIYEDHGEAAAKVFEEREKHYFAQYPLVSTYPTNYKSVVEAASRALGKEIRIERISFEHALERLLLYYNRRGLLGNPNVTEWLLGRRPTTLEDFIERAVKTQGLG